MHNCQHYLDRHLLVSVSNLSAVAPLSALQASTLESCLVQDAKNYCYSGTVTLFESLMGASRSFYTWATVKAYYSVFYFLRAKLAANKVGIAYLGKSPFSINATPGSVPVAGKGTTHEFVLKLFASTMGSNWLLSQKIGLDSPLDWMRWQREAANYKVAKFEEPITPKLFAQFATQGLRKAITSYTAAANYPLAFDPDHAIIALPLNTCRLTLDLLDCSSINPYSKDDLEFLKGICNDRSGALPEIARLLLRS